MFIEVSKSTAEIFSADYVRGRVLLLDDDQELATTLGGAQVADATLEFVSKQFGSQAQFSLQPVTDRELAGADWRAAADSVSVGLDAAWQEFAVRYHTDSGPALKTGIDTITITAKKGTATISGSVNLTVQAPEADSYVVRTGQLTLPDVLEEIPGRNANSGATTDAGEQLTVHVFAARLQGGRYYFTDNVPSDAARVVLRGLYLSYSGGGRSVGSSVPNLPAAAYDSSMAVELAAATLQLPSGYAATTFTIEDLRIPAILAADTNVTGAAAAAPIADQTAALLDGFGAYWWACPRVTRTVGAGSGDVTTAGQLNIAKDKLLGYAASDYDTSQHKPNVLDTIIITGLPLNQITSGGVHQVSGWRQFNIDYAAGGDISAYEGHPNDAWLLLPDASAKPSVFRTAGGTAAAAGSATAVFGAILGYDAYGNPSAFVNGATTTFTLQRDGGGDVPRAVNTGAWELRPLESWGTVGADPLAADAGKITTTKTYQAFLPFRIAAQREASPSVEKLFIADGGTVAATRYAGVDSLTEGVSFTAQDYIEAVTVTNPGGNRAANDEDRVQVLGSASERQFDLRVLTGGDTVLISADDDDPPADALAVPRLSGSLAQRDAVYFTAAKSTRPLHYLFTGSDAGTVCVQVLTPTADLTPARPNSHEPSAIVTALDSVSANLDDEGDHDTLGLSAVCTAYDAFGNAYARLDDADLDSSVFLADENGEATAQAFPGATAKISSDLVEVGFSLDQITAETDRAVLRLATEGGAVSEDILLMPLAAKALACTSIFVPIEGIAGTPVELCLADQDGALIAPVTGTTGPGRVPVELEADGGTISAAATETLTTDSPRLVFTADIAGDSDLMTVSAGSDYGDVDLQLQYIEPEGPTIGTPTSAPCGFEIRIIDSVPIDTESISITMLTSSGEDVTSKIEKVEITNYEDTYDINIYVMSLFFGPGSFAVTVKVKNVYGVEAEATKIVTLSNCEPVQGCQLSPYNLVPGETADITINGSFTSFDDTTAVSIGCSDVTINSTTVVSETEVIVNVSVAPDATSCKCSVSAGDVDCGPVLSLGCETACIDNDGDGYYSYDSLDCPDGDDCNDANAIIHPDAAEKCNDGIDNDCDGLFDLDDDACAEDEPPDPVDNATAGCGIRFIWPYSVKAACFLPRLERVTIYGKGDDFDSRAAVDFASDDIFVLRTVPQRRDRIAVYLLVRGGAQRSVFDVTVGECDKTKFIIR